jgi:exodeoxyribonuclease V alpha subunit
VLAGGPGTGKTTTVARLLAALQDQANGSLRVALAAPTAVAAKRLTLAARHAAESFEEADQQRLGSMEAVTLHRLLGWRPGSRTRFRHDRENRLPFDVVVVDEASMVPLTMMSRLVDALRPRARLVLVGDPDQLASIEAGAVLGDLVQRMENDEQQSLVRLFEVHRYSTEIHTLAEAVRSGQPDRVLDVLDRGDRHIEFVEDADIVGLRDDVIAAGTALHEAARRGDGELALQRLRQHQILCGHREGSYGVAHWTAQSEEWLRGAIRGYAADGRWYVGRPLLVTSNDYQLRLFNGDTGVVVDVGGQARAAFLRDGRVDLLAPSRLSDVQTVHAMSVHRAQGSQYDRVTLVLPPVDSPLLTRELLDTGLTRAKEHVRIIGTRDAVAAAVDRPVVRASGLRTRR